MVDRENPDERLAWEMAGIPYDLPEQFPENFAVELRKAHSAGLIRGDFDFISRDMFCAFHVSQKEAVVTHAAERAARKVTGAERHKRLAGLIDRLADHLKDDLDDLEALRDDVDDLGELDHLDAICDAITRRRAAHKAVAGLRGLLDEPRLVELKPNAAWDEQRYFAQIVSAWRDASGSLDDDGINSLCDIATALWRGMGRKIPNWQTDNPDRTWAKRRVKPLLKNDAEHFASRKTHD